MHFCSIGPSGKAFAGSHGEKGYVAGKYREARDTRGCLSYISSDDEKTILDKLPLVELTD